MPCSTAGPFRHRDHEVGVPDGGEPVRDHDRGAALAQPGKCGLHGGLVLGVERAGRFVEQQDARVAQQGAGERDPLALAAGRR